MRYIIYLFSVFFFLLLGCIEPYDFGIKNDKPTLVIESYLSNKSFNESINYPSDGRYIYVKLHYTSDVTSTKDLFVEGASVVLSDSEGNSWKYLDIGNGEYILFDYDFKAVNGVDYQLKVTLSNEASYISTWEHLVNVPNEELGDISFKESERLVYKLEAGEKEIRNVKGVEVYTSLNKNSYDENLYYRWKFDPIWIYVAPLAATHQYDRKCWATNSDYLANYILQEDEIGGYEKELFFLEIDGNERVYEKFSTLIVQQIISKDYYYYWELIKNQSQGSGVFDSPPANLPTNFKNVTSDGNEVFGYFGIINETAKRWYFDIGDLSYHYYNNLSELCRISYGPPLPGEPNECKHCEDYSNGTALVYKPIWWEDN